MYVRADATGYVREYEPARRAKAEHPQAQWVKDMVDWFTASLRHYVALGFRCLVGVLHNGRSGAVTGSLRASGVDRFRFTKEGLSWSTSLAVLMMVCGVGAALPAQADSNPVDAEWHEFNGTWTAAGSRQAIGLGGDRRASVADYSGSLMLYGPSRPALGFRAEAVVLNDSFTGLVGRAVWTDDVGDQVYSELRGETTSTGNRIFGTFVGGSGRYQGATGTYKFSWRFLLEAEDGTVQGQSMGLNGKVRFMPARSGPGGGASRP
jgi:hypothetical protein